MIEYDAYATPSKKMAEVIKHTENFLKTKTINKKLAYAKTLNTSRSDPPHNLILSTQETTKGLSVKNSEPQEVTVFELRPDIPKENVKQLVKDLKKHLVKKFGEAEKKVVGENYDEQFSFEDQRLRHIFSGGVSLKYVSKHKSPEEYLATPENKIIVGLRPEITINKERQEYIEWLLKAKPLFEPEE